MAESSPFFKIYYSAFCIFMSRKRSTSFIYLIIVKHVFIFNWWQIFRPLLRSLFQCEITWNSKRCRRLLHHLLFHVISHWKRLLNGGRSICHHLNRNVCFTLETLKQRCQFMKMVGGPRLTDLANLPTPIFFSSDFGHFILKIQKKNFKKWKKKKKKNRH